MKAKDKANDLFNRYWDELYSDVSITNLVCKDNTKQCALICVEEQIKLIDDYSKRQMLTNWANALGYWQEVKQEIEKL